MRSLGLYNYSVNEMWKSLAVCPSNPFACCHPNMVGYPGGGLKDKDTKRNVRGRAPPQFMSLGGGTGTLQELD